MRARVAKMKVVWLSYFLTNKIFHAILCAPHVVGSEGLAFKNNNMKYSNTFTMRHLADSFIESD